MRERMFREGNQSQRRMVRMGLLEESRKQEVSDRVQGTQRTTDETLKARDR